MTIASGENLKAVQEIIIDEAVTALNVYYYKADFVEPQTEQDVVDLLELTMEALYDQLTGQTKSTVEMGDLAVYVRDGLVWTLIGTGTPGVTNTNNTDMMPHGVAALVRAYTEHPRTIGRKYMAGFCEDGITNGVFIAATLTALANFGVQWTTTREITPNNNLIPGVWSTVALTVRVMDGVKVVPVIPGYQRRRRPGSGM